MKTASLFPVFLLCFALRIEAQESWVAQTNGIPAGTGILNSVDFIDTNTGWADGIYKTTNGGATWTSSGNGGDDWQSNDFVNANNGWTVGLNGYISRTTNGGTSWTLTNTYAGSYEFNSVRFANATTGWVGGFSKTFPNKSIVLKTTNGGASWTVQDLGSFEHLYGLYFLDANTGWAVGEGIFKTVNGGANWAIQLSDTNLSPVILQSVFFLDANTGWAVGSPPSTILKTINGGVTWVAQPSGLATTQSLNSVFFVNSNVGWIAGSSGTLLKTINGGTTWNLQSIPSTNGLLEVYFTDAIHGWAVGGNGTVLKHIGTPVPILTNRTSSEYFQITQQGRLTYQLPTQARIKVLLFDTRGGLALKLFEGTQQSGYHDLFIPNSFLRKQIFLDFQSNQIRKLVRLQKSR